MLKQEDREGAGNSDCCAVVRGTTTLKTVVLPIATGIPPTTVTTMWVFGWCAVVLAALSCTRTGGWEFVGRVKGESRPVPVMLVTASKHKTGLGSLVGVKAEDLPSLKKARSQESE